MTASLSTHVLDAAIGGPRAGVPVTVRDEAGVVVGSGATDAEGRIPRLATDLVAGAYEITWASGGGFLAAVSATVTLIDNRHYHVPLLASSTSAVVYLGQ